MLRRAFDLRSASPDSKGTSRMTAIPSEALVHGPSVRSVHSTICLRWCT